MNPEEDLGQALKIVAVETALDLFRCTLHNCHELQNVDLSKHFGEATALYHEGDVLMQKKALLAQRAFNKMKEIAALFDEIDAVETQQREERNDPSRAEA